MNPIMSVEDDRAAQSWIHYVESTVELETLIGTVLAREVWIREYTKLQLDPPRWHAHPWIRGLMRYAAA